MLDILDAADTSFAAVVGGAALVTLKGVQYCKVIHTAPVHAFANVESCFVSVSHFLFAIM